MHLYLKIPLCLHTIPINRKGFLVKKFKVYLNYTLVGIRTRDFLTCAKIRLSKGERGCRPIRLSALSSKELPCECFAEDQ